MIRSLTPPQAAGNALAFAVQDVGYLYTVIGLFDRFGDFDVLPDDGRAEE
jgi:hypothetical protein